MPILFLTGDVTSFTDEWYAIIYQIDILPIGAERLTASQHPAIYGGRYTTGIYLKIDF